ncbi:MAG: VWA domain-containing protein [Gemmataceae bacterium]
MSLRKLILGGGMLCLALLLSGSARADDPKTPGKTEAKAAEKPRVEVVFCLDTTGSMGGLIDAAKKKIWSICNQISTGKPTPHVKVGLVAYRDRGDSFITKVFELTDDLDTVYKNVMSFTADEGGDEPESVNQALFDAVHKITWSKDKKVLKMIFLVGDAPPHMDYPDDVKYPETCKEAVKRDIIINTVLCGNSASAKEHWLKICRAAEGSFVQIDAGGGPVVAVATPFDKDLAALNAKISETTLVYGKAEEQLEKKALADTTAKLDAPAAAGRAGFYARAGDGGAAYCLINALKAGKVKLEALKKEELPDQLKGKSLEQQREYIKKVEKEREVLTQNILDLDKKRNEFIAKKASEDAKLAGSIRDSFDGNVLRILGTQAARNGITYTVPEEPKKK